MSDFTSGFWDFYIGITTLISVLGCGLLLWSQAKYKSERSTASAQQETTGHVWDENLTELNTPMPRWWMWLFYITIVFALFYLALYPGLGSYAGKLGWKSAGAYQNELKVADARYAPLFDKYLQQDLKTVAADPQAHAMGERLFLTYCAQCHGSDARGSKGFPNLTDHDWLFGGEPDVIKTTIMKGRNGQMPSMAAIIGAEQDVANVTHYVASLSGANADPVMKVLGQKKFGACAACHGADGRGNQLMGAPNLTDTTWLFGSNGNPKEVILESIRKGRSSAMPPFEDFLGEAKVHVLAAYVWSLSNNTGSVIALAGATAGKP
jgi:cytochrome c oxidase cbb3-type subunit 3